jgi:hypothetical protein
MDLSAVMAEVKTRTSAVSGLARTSIGFAGKINAPAAVVYPPDAVEFDGGYGRAADRYADLLVVVFVAAPTPDRGIAALAPYLSSAGTKSIKKALDSVVTAYASATSVTVVRAQIDGAARIGGVDYLAAIFHLTVDGPAT